MPAIIKEDIDRLFQLGIYLPTRTIYLGGIRDDDSVDEAWSDAADEPGIYWNTARRVIMGIHVLDSNAQGGRKPITIIMNSCGGDYSHGMAIYDAIKHAKNHITVINMSHARSMTSLIFQAGDLRITAPNGHYMIHDGEMAESGTPKTVRNWVEYEHKICLPKMYKIYLDRLHEEDEGEPKIDVEVVADIINSKLPKGATKINAKRGIKGIRLAHIEQLCSQDTIFTAEEMVKLNFADRILDTNDLVGPYANPKMHDLPTGLESMHDEEDE
jgi:ATP-dependent protease ClpP protease subunit